MQRSGLTRFRAPAARWQQHPWSIRRPFLECASARSLRLFPPVGSQSRWGRTPKTRRLLVCPADHLSRVQRAHHHLPYLAIDFVAGGFDLRNDNRSNLTSVNLQAP